MNETEPQRGNVSPVVWLLGALTILALLFGIGSNILVPMSNEATRRAEERTIQIQAAEHEATERERLAQTTHQQLAQLRAEETARIVNYAALAGLVGLVAMIIILAAGFLFAAVNWLDNQQTRRTLLILEAQRQAAPFQLPAPRPHQRTFDRAALAMHLPTRAR
jgi:hypothetical protein